MTSTAPFPEIVHRYLRAADVRDSQACAECFTVDGTVLDEGKTYRGREEISAWREGASSQWSYTTTVTASEATGDTAYRVMADLDGDFPGGHASLNFDFALRDGLIAELRIVE